MAISDDLIEETILALSGLSKIEMDPDDLADDVFLLAEVFREETRFLTAVAQLERSLNLLVQNGNLGTSLRRNYSEWSSFHFQSTRKNHQRADLRIIYQAFPEFIRVRGFGHRHMPQDIYKRLSQR